MKILTQLTAQAVDGTVTRIRTMQAVHNEPKPGFIRKVELDACGVIVSHGTAAVCIPMESLLALAIEAEPGLAPA